MSKGRRKKKKELVILQKLWRIQLEVFFFSQREYRRLSDLSRLARSKKRIGIEDLLTVRKSYKNCGQTCLRAKARAVKGPSRAGVGVVLALPSIYAWLGLSRTKPSKGLQYLGSYPTLEGQGQVRAGSGLQNKTTIFFLTLLPKSKCSRALWVWSSITTPCMHIPSYKTHKNLDIKFMLR